VYFEDTTKEQQTKTNKKFKLKWIYLILKF